MPQSKKIFLASLLLFCALAGLWRFYFVEFFLKLPADFSYEAELSSVDNFYNKEKGAYEGDQFSTATFSYKTLSTSKVGSLIENNFEVKDSSGEEIIQLQRLYGIDPQSTEHVKGLGDKDREGTLFAPQNLKPGETFTYWHVNYDAPAQMAYLGRENLFGLEVQTYESSYEGELIDQTLELDHLEGVPEEWGILLEPRLKLWVEPKTGWLVNYEDHTTAYYYDIKTGEKLNPWNQFSNTFTESSVKEKVSEAKTLKFRTWALEEGLPFLLLSVAGLCFLLCLRRQKHEVEGNFGVHWMIHVFFIGFPITLILFSWHLIESQLDQKNELEFNQRITEIEDSLIRKVDIAITSLEGIQGLFQASEQVDKEEWNVYVTQLGLEKKYPGIKAVGYSPVIWDVDKTAHLNSMQESNPTYNLRPEGEREFYVPVVYIEPTTERNLMLLGHDTWTVELRKEAMESARDTGASALSGKLVFSGVSSEDQKVGAASVLYIPLYKKGLPLSTTLERRSALEGYAFASFWIDDFIEGVFKSTPLGVDFAIYDGVTLTSENLLYEYKDNPELLQEESFRTKIETITIGGRAWTFEFKGLEEFRSSRAQKWISYALLGVALLLCLLHVFVYSTLVISRGRAMQRIQSSLGKAPAGSKRKTLKAKTKR